MSRYPEIDVAGSPYEMGRQIGEAARDQVRGFCEVGLARTQKTVAVSTERAQQIAAACIPLAEAYAPHMMDELRGVAESAGVTLTDLMMLQVRNQFKPESDAGCTSFCLSQEPTQMVVGQNWDNDPALDEFTIVLTRRPLDKPPLMTVTQAGLIAYIGLNSTGIGACLNTLPAPSREIGVPHYFTLREIYEQDSLDGAVRAIRRAARAIPANIMLATPQGPADLEITKDDVFVLRDPQRVTHTNHALHPEIVAVNDEFPELIESYPRKQRIDELVDSQSSVEQCMDALRDHDGYPKSICRHANEHPDNGYWTTVFSGVIEPHAGRMFVSRGTPCDHPYEAYSL